MTRQQWLRLNRLVTDVGPFIEALERLALEDRLGGGDLYPEAQNAAGALAGFTHAARKALKAARQREPLEAP